MGMNIKSERVHALAREAARRTGQSQTQVVENALRLLLDGIEAPRQVRDGALRELLAGVDRRLDDDDRAALAAAADDLYDSHGLPA